VRVAFVVNDLQLSGGVGVVIQHAHQLSARHGFDVSLVLARERDVPDWRHRGLTDVPVLGLPAARRERFDVALATWWETSYALFELQADRYAYFVQSLEDRFYRPDEPERLAAALTHDLPVALVTEAQWIAETLEALRPGVHVHYVRNGIAKDLFSAALEPEPLTRGAPLRILVEGSRSWFKGVDDALAATAAMDEPRHVTLVSSDGSAPAGRDSADRVVGPVSHAEMAALYAESHVVLKLSRVEGMYGPPLEGFHMGATTVTTAVTGHEEYVRHGWNGLLVEWDDVRGTARALDLLARDRSLLHFLRHNARRTAIGWPSWEQQGMVMAAALRAIHRAPPVRSGADAIVADALAAVQTQRAVVAERDRLRYRIAPLLALERVMEHRAVRWVTRPLRRAWGATRRTVSR
jgi:glycosyltransferase involved in cell wall biosynthesis